MLNDNVSERQMSRTGKSTAPQTFSPFLPRLPLHHLQHSSERQSRVSNLQYFAVQYALK